MLTATQRLLAAQAELARLSGDVRRAKERRDRIRRLLALLEAATEDDVFSVEFALASCRLSKTEFTAREQP